jgi:hypothetical protein
MLKDLPAEVVEHRLSEEVHICERYSSARPEVGRQVRNSNSVSLGASGKNDVLFHAHRLGSVAYEYSYRGDSGMIPDAYWK